MLVYIRMGYSARQMAIQPKTGWLGHAERKLRGLARWRLRSLLVQFPFELWALQAHKALQRSPSPAIIN